MKISLKILGVLIAIIMIASFVFLNVRDQQYDMLEMKSLSHSLAILADGNETNGNYTGDGNQTNGDGNETNGNQTNGDGNETNGNQTNGDGNETNGNQTNGDGNETNGNQTNGDGNYTGDGNQTNGNYTNGNITYLEDIGYLIYNNTNATYDSFYCNATQNETLVHLQDDGSYLIDSDGDEKWDYIYDPASEGINLYQEDEEDKGKGVSGFLLITIIGAMVLVLYIKRRMI